jgi:hypothetical protein
VAVAAKRLAHAQLVDGAMHRSNDRRRQRLGYIPDAAADQPPGCVRICLPKLADAAGDLRKEIASLKLEIVVV